MPKLIFIEGISGVGKSTMTQKLSDALRAMGYSARAYLEFDYTNPIDFYCTAYFTYEEYEKLHDTFAAYADVLSENTIIAGDVRLIRYYDANLPLFPEPLLSALRECEFCYNPTTLVPLAEYTRVYRAVWRGFAENAAGTYDFLLFDGSLLHHPINDMMRNYNVSCDQAAAHVNTLLDSVKSLRREIVYLSSDNIVERLTKAHISRKQAAPTDTQIQFWRKRNQMDEAVLCQMQAPYEVYMISNDGWDIATESALRKMIKTSRLL